MLTPEEVDEIEKSLVKVSSVEKNLIATLRAARAERDLAQLDKKATISTVIWTVKGTVEGLPTQSINYLQRLRELVDNEERLRETQQRIAELEGYCYDVESGEVYLQLKAQRDRMAAALQEAMPFVHRFHCDAENPYAWQACAHEDCASKRTALADLPPKENISTETLSDAQHSALLEESLQKYNPIWTKMSDCTSI